ncbi:cysteine hydrolase [Roseovarius sp. SCSIO 43702]|nr:cysteine hydrolase [Roseovarius sp. SCSIO 43702]
MAGALILVDIQKGFDSPVWGARNNPGAEANAGRLLAAWREAGKPICHIRHVSPEPGSPLGPGGDGTEFKAEVAPRDGEPVFEKNVNSAFIGTGLGEHLHALDETRVTICGLTTPHCVSTTARMAANLGFHVTLAHDACAAFAANARTDWAGDVPALSPEAVHHAAVSILHGEFARALSTDMIVAAK